MNRIQRKLIAPAFFACILLTGALAIAVAGNQQAAPAPAPSRAYLHAYNLPSSGLALDGYCPVSYFLADDPVPGKPEFTATYNDVDYQFMSADAMRMFESNPEKYAPAYGGWCAFGMAIEDKFPVDPLSYKIVDGRLMVFLKNRNVDALALWNQNDEAAQVAKAEAHWNKVSQ